MRLSSVSFCGWAISTPPSTPLFTLFSVLNSGKHLRSCYADGETITTDQDTCNKIKFNKSEIIPVRVSQNCDMIENRIHHHGASLWGKKTLHHAASKNI